MYEFGGIPIKKFIGLELKMYSILCDGSGKLSAKGVTNYTQKQIKHAMWKVVILTGRFFRALNTRIGSKSQQLQTIASNKLSLSCFDDKFFIKDHRNAFPPLGHYLVRDIIVFREIAEDSGWVNVESPRSPTWDDLYREVFVPFNF